MAEIEISKIYALSPMQEGMLFHSLMQGKSSNFGQIVFNIEGKLDIDRFKRSFQLLVERYDVLRTVFIYEEVDQPLQVVLKERNSDVFFEDISHLDESGRNEHIEAFKKSDIHKGFDLSSDMLTRIALFYMGVDSYKVIWSMHPVLMDGWCMGIITKDFFEIYRALKYGRPLELEAVYPYSSYIEWLEKQDGEEAALYWKKYLENYENQASLPAVIKPLGEGGYEYREIKFSINEFMTDKLKSIAKDNGVTLNTLFQTIWGILLQRYNDTSDVVFGAVVSGRPAQIYGIEKMVGLFINTVPVRINSDGASFAELIKDVQKSALSSEQYSYFPLYEIQSCIGWGKELVNHIIIFDNYPIQKEIESSKRDRELDFAVKDFEGFEQINYDFNITVLPSKELSVKFSYNALVYDRRLLDMVKGHIAEIVRKVTKNPHIRVRDIDILTEAEQRQILCDFNHTRAQYQYKPVHQLFEEQVDRTPDKDALIFGDRKLTYKELNFRSNRLARVLRDKGSGPDKIIGIMVERSFDMLIGLLAVLKSGGAYLPIDPDFPRDRIEYMLEDSGASLLLTQSHLEIGFAGERMDIDNEGLCGEYGSNLPIINTPGDLAYVIYTSGSTGKPKGVMLEHRSVNNFINGITELIDFSPEKTILALTTISFDIFVLETLLPLSRGLSVALAGKNEQTDSKALNDLMIKNCVNMLQATPSRLQLLIEDGACLPGMGKLSEIMVGGEAFPVSLLEDLNRLTSAGIYNMYGPTETTVWSGVKELTGATEVNIGKPIANTRIYILNKHNMLQPPGIIGELCIAGDGLARGYLNRPELNSEKFVSDPFNTGCTMYKTGDLARWLPDGDIECLGRTDSQVKIRGYRIELGEVEAQLLSYEPVREAAAVLKVDSSEHKYICAYIVPDCEVKIPEIRAYLSKTLPDYMIPSYFIALDEMPLTHNGKIDRKALVEAEGDIMSSGMEYEAPVTRMEIRLAEIWREVLGIERAGVNDNFFELGGHSLKATTLMAKIHKEFDVRIPLSRIFQSPTIKEISKIIAGGEENIYATIEPVAEKEYYPVSSAQKRMYALNKLGGGGIGYNIPGVLMVEGELDTGSLERAVRTLVKRHEMLRTSFDLTDGEPVQRVRQKVDIQIEYSSAGNENIKDIARAFIRPFDLGKAPLFRVGLVKLNTDKCLMLFDIHHIIADGISMTILIKEFVSLYSGKSLPAQRVQYKDFSIWQNNLFKTDHIKKQEAYWLNMYQGEIPVLNMPTDYPRPPFQSFEGDSISFKLDRDVYRGLKRMISETGTTIYTVLLAVYNILLSKYTGSEDVIVGSPIAGRPHADLEQMVGTFVNTLAVRNYPEGRKTFGDFLNEVRENTLEAFENQDYQFDELLNKIALKRDLSRNPLFDVVLLMNNIDISTMNIEGLKFTPYELESRVAQFDMKLQALELDDELQFRLEYCTKLYKKETIIKLAEHFTNLMEQALKNPGIKISDMSVLHPGERNSLVFDFNNTQADYPVRTLQALLEEQAEKNPHRRALEFRNRSMTYKELNEKANGLACTLREMGVGRSNIVGIMAEHSIEAVVGILAVLKAGGAFLPMDPGYPGERIKYIIEESKVKILLVQNKLMEKVNGFASLMDLDDDSLYDRPGDNLKNINSEEDPAYIIFTSGSTGKPKGAVIPHRGIVNYIRWADKVYVRGGELAFPLYSSLAFDLTITSLFTPLVSGNKMVIYGGGSKEFLIERIFEEDQVGIVKLTPTHLRLIKELEPKKSNIKRLIVGGEDLKTSLAKEIHSFFGGEIEIFNEYGPTEATVGCMIYKYDPARDLRLSVPIGKPADNVQIYLLDRYLKPVPPGVTGEIYISGDGVAKGYLNRLDLTEERFIENPFIPGKKMYKSGDLARMLPGGNIEFKGRSDHQVKIRGFRIEMGEIEAELLKHKGIHGAAVDVRERGSKEGRRKEERYCVECGLSSSYPGTTFDDSGVCNICTDYKAYRHKTDLYFKTLPDLEGIFENNTSKSEYDCIVLFSGGKDSSYVLYKLVDMGLKVLAFTFDNGYISETALDNIKTIVTELNVDLVVAREENMNRVFCESLRIESNVCNGCFKALLALSTQMAYEKGIKYVVTGLSRGQIYEMRLMNLFNSGIFEPGEIDRAVLDARKGYHGMDDYISRLLDVDLLKDEKVFEQVEFIDYYRYSDVTKKEIFDFLKERNILWSRPSDTGFCSSNCRINDVGIYIHCREKGYHNYALPTSWEVRTGHLTIEAGRKELEGNVNTGEVESILEEIGYEEAGGKFKQQDSYLTAYYTAKDSIEENELREHLAKNLPDYMIPVYFVRIEKIPLSRNGKVDTKLLPDPWEKVVKTGEYRPPRNNIEEKLIELWQEVLGVNKLGINDNFFRLGGDSIKAIQILTRLQKYNMKLEIKDFFQYPFISRLSDFVRPYLKKAEQAPVVGEVRLTPIQKWFFERKFTEMNHWNQSVMLFRKDGFKEEAVRRVFGRIVEHHDILRAVYRMEGETVIQFNRGCEEELFDLQIFDLINHPDFTGAAAEYADSLHKGLNLSGGPLVRLGLFKTREGDHLLVVIHHLLVDGVSWRIILEDFSTGYTQSLCNEEITLADKTDSFMEWAKGITTYAGSSELMKEFEYWQDIENNSLHALAEDHAADVSRYKDSASLSLSLPEETTEKLLTQVNQAYNTETGDVLLTALGLALKEWSGVERICVSLEGHGREEVLKNININRTVGWFTSRYPVILDTSKCEGIEKQLKLTKETIRRIPNKGIGYGILRYLSPGLQEKGVKFSLEPEISFNYLGQFDRDIRTGTFEISRLWAGAPMAPGCERSFVLDINGMVVGGKFVLSVNYDKNQYAESVIQRLIQCYENNLNNIIESCIQKEKTELTPGDFIYSDFSLDEFEDLKNEINELIDE